MKIGDTERFSAPPVAISSATRAALSGLKLNRNLKTAVKFQLLNNYFSRLKSNIQLEKQQFWWITSQNSRNLPACPLPGMLLPRGNTSLHLSRFTWSARQSSQTISIASRHCSAVKSSVRSFMSLLLSHCTPEEPGGRRFIWAPFLCAPERSASAADGEKRCVLIHAQCATRSDCPHALTLFE